MNENAQDIIRLANSGDVVKRTKPGTFLVSKTKQPSNQNKLNDTHQIDNKNKTNEASILSDEELTFKYAVFKAAGYRPHPKQRLFHNSAARHKLANCGRRFGKSVMTSMELVAELMKPNVRAWIVGDSYTIAEKEFRVVHDTIVNKLGITPRKKYYNMQQGQLYLQLDWGSSVECKSTKYPDLLVGDSLDVLLMSEASKQDEGIYTRYLRAALADRQGKLLAGTTPEGHNWYYELWLKGQKSDGIHESWRFPSWENPYVFKLGRNDPEILQLEADMTDDLFKQEIEADFSSFEGKIFPEFGPDEHVRTVEFRPHLKNYMAIDFGYTNPLAAIEFQIDETGCVRVWREHYKKFTTLVDHINIMKNRPQPDGYRLDMAFADAADPEGVVTLNRKLVHSVADQASKANWREGVDLIRNLLKHKQLNETNDGIIVSSRLFVDRSCSNLIREFQNYKANRPNKGRNVAECAVNQDDHALDALRYGLMHVMRLGYGESFDAVYNLNKPVHETQVGNAAQLSSFYYEDRSEGYFTSNLDF